MQVITTVSDKYFTLNGTQYAKIYQPLKSGSEGIAIHNVYDTRLKILGPVKYDEFQINGVVYGNQLDAVSAILSAVFNFKIQSDVIAELDLKIDKGGYLGTAQDLKNDIDAVQFEGAKTYQTLAELQAVNPVPATGTASKVSNDPTQSNNGYYSVSAGAWVKDLDLYENEISESNNTKGVTGQAVYRSQYDQNSSIAGATRITSRQIFISSFGQDAYINTSGASIVAADWRRTSISDKQLMIKVQPNKKYLYSGEIIAASNPAGVVYVDSNLALISVEITAVGTYLEQTLNVPSSADFILACSYASDPIIIEQEAVSDSFKESAQFPLYAAPIVIVEGEFIRNTTGVNEANTAFKRTELIEIASLPSEALSIDVGTRGPAVAFAAYYSSNVISSGSFIGYENITGYAANEDSKQLYNKRLSIPIGATHVALSSYKGFNMSLYAASGLPQNEKQIVLSSSPLSTGAIAYNQLNENPYGFEAVNLQKRAAVLANLSDNNVFPLVFIVGQSNADGRVPYSSAPAWFTATGGLIDDFMVWNKNANSFQSYESGVNVGAENNLDTRYSFDIHFVKNFIDENPGKKIYAIKQTLGGTPISEKGAANAARFQPKTELIPGGERQMLTELLNKFKAAVAYAQVNNIVFVPAAILFHQGEADSVIGALAVNDYQQNLSNLISWIRGLFMAPKLPFINADVVSTFNAFSPDINTIFGNLNSLDEYMRTVDMSLNETTIDGVHFDAPAIEFMGNEMYNNYKIFNPIY